MFCRCCSCLLCFRAAGEKIKKMASRRAVGETGRRREPGVLCTPLLPPRRDLFKERANSQYPHYGLSNVFVVVDMCVRFLRPFAVQLSSSWRSIICPDRRGFFFLLLLLFLRRANLFMYAPNWRFISGAVYSHGRWG